MAEQNQETPVRKRALGRRPIAVIAVAAALVVVAVVGIAVFLNDQEQAKQEQTRQEQIAREAEEAEWAVAEQYSSKMAFIPDPSYAYYYSGQGIQFAIGYKSNTTNADKKQQLEDVLKGGDVEELQSMKGYLVFFDSYGDYVGDYKWEVTSTISAATPIELSTNGKAVAKCEGYVYSVKSSQGEWGNKDAGFEEARDHGYKFSFDFKQF